jgi:Protein of unknown function (DUF3800)
METCISTQAKTLTKSRPALSRNLAATTLATRIRPQSPSVEWVGLKAAQRGPKSSPRNSAARLHAKRPKHAGKRLPRQLPSSISSVPRWIHWVLPVKERRGRVFCVLHCYLDDSGTHKDSPVCVVAGYYGSTRHWLNFDRDWHAILKAEGLQEFHANRFWAHATGKQIPEYAGWASERQDRLIGSLLQVIGKHGIYPVSGAVVMGEWAALPRDERQVLTGAAMKGPVVATTGAANRPYFLPFLFAIRRAAEYCKPGHKMDFFFDESHRLARYTAEYFRIMKGFRADFATRLGQSSIVESKTSAPTQAADLLAYEVYVYLRKRIEQGIGIGLKRRPVFDHAIRRIKSIQEDMKLFDKASIDMVLQDFRNKKLTQHSH